MQCSYPDVWTTATQFADYNLLNSYFGNRYQGVNEADNSRQFPQFAPNFLPYVQWSAVYGHLPINPVLSDNAFFPKAYPYAQNCRGLNGAATTGCSGGAIAQQHIANAYPGIYQGIIVQCSYPDVSLPMIINLMGSVERALEQAECSANVQLQYRLLELQAMGKIAEMIQHSTKAGLTAVALIGTSSVSLQYFNLLLACWLGSHPNFDATMTGAFLSTWKDRLAAPYQEHLTRFLNETQFQSLPMIINLMGSVERALEQAECSANVQLQYRLLEACSTIVSCY